MRFEPGSANENFDLDAVDKGATGVAPAIPARVFAPLLTGENGKNVGVAGGSKTAALFELSWLCAESGVENEGEREDEDSCWWLLLWVCNQQQPNRRWWWGGRDEEKGKKKSDFFPLFCLEN